MISGDAISHSVQFAACTGALSAPVSASIAHLKVNGTASVASLASSSSTIDQTTRILRSARSPGQMYGHRCTSVPIRVASTGFSGAGSASPAAGAEWVWAINQSLENRCRVERFCCSAFRLSYRAFVGGMHPHGLNSLAILGHLPVDSLV